MSGYFFRGIYFMSVSLDTNTGYTSQPGGTTMTLSGLTVGTGSNRALAVLLSCGSQGTALPAGLTLTWDSGGTNQALTQVPNTFVADGGLTAVAAVYGLLAPTPGNKNLVISWTGANEMHALAASFAGVDQTSIAVAFPNGAVHSVSGAGASPCTVTINSATGDMTIATHAQNFSAFGTISGTTLGVDNPTGPNISVASNLDNGASTVTMTAAFTGTGANMSVGCDVKAAAGGGGSPMDWYTPTKRRFIGRR
jgi:hypothetical protein